MKEEGWWLVVGDCATGELYALKRVGFLARTSVKLKVPSSALDGELMLYCMSDCYLGLDQQIVLTSRPSHAAPQRPRLRHGKPPPPPPPPPPTTTETDLAGWCNAVERAPSPPLPLSPRSESQRVLAVLIRPHKCALRCLCMLSSSRHFPTLTRSMRVCSFTATDGTSDDSDDEFWDMSNNGQAAAAAAEGVVGGASAMEMVGATARRGDQGGGGGKTSAEDFWVMQSGAAAAIRAGDACAVDVTEAQAQLVGSAAPGAEGSSDDDDDDQGFWLPSR